MQTNSLSLHDNQEMLHHREHAKATKRKRAEERETETEEERQRARNGDKTKERERRGGGGTKGTKKPKRIISSCFG